MSKQLKTYCYHHLTFINSYVQILSLVSFFELINPLKKMEIDFCTTIHEFLKSLNCVTAVCLN